MTETLPSLKLKDLFKDLFNSYVSRGLSAQETEDYRFSVVEYRIKLESCLFYSEEIEYLAAIALMQYYACPWARLDLITRRTYFLLAIHPYSGEVTLKMTFNPEAGYARLTSLKPEHFLPRLRKE